MPIPNMPLKEVFREDGTVLKVVTRRGDRWDELEFLDDEFDEVPTDDWSELGVVSRKRNRNQSRDSD